MRLVQHSNKELKMKLNKKTKERLEETAYAIGCGLITIMLAVMITTGW